MGFDAEKFRINDYTPIAAIRDDTANAIWLACQCVHAVAKAKGWWDRPRENLELFALMHSEISEAVEATRLGNPPSQHVPEISGIAEEMADICIRVFDYCAAHGIDLGDAIQRKHAFNCTRPYRHGNKTA